MAEITSPLSTAMKTRAKAAVDAIDDGTPNYASRTPRQLRALILSQARSPSVRTAMIAEGWFIAASSPAFSSASNTAVDVS
jgi:hypothetical protein